MHLSRGRFSAQNARRPLLFQKRTVEEFAGSKMGVMRDTGEYSGRGSAAGAMLRRRKRVLG